MSVQSVNSIETTYGSCVGSDAESIVSRKTFKSARSSSTTYFSGDSDTDTLVNFGEEGDCEAFFDVVDDDLSLGPDNQDNPQEMHHENNSDDETISQDIDTIPAIVELGLRSSTPRPVPTRTHSSTEMDRLIENVAPPVSSESSISRDVDATIALAEDVYSYQPIVTRIATRQVGNPPAISRVSNLILFGNFVLIVACSLSFQCTMRYNSQLNSWLLVFYRSLIQLFVSGSILGFWKKQIFGTPGMRLKLLFHSLMGSLSIFGMLFSSERLYSQELAGIFLFAPVPTLLVEQFFLRGVKSLHVTLFLMVSWMCSVLLLTHNFPSQSVVISNSSNESATERWNPPLFGLDNIQMWPIFPHQYANPDEQSIGGLRVSGFTVGIIAMISLSATPVLSVMSSYEISFQILFWQSGGALLASCAGLLVRGKGFLFSRSIDWVYCILIASLGFIGNIANTHFLSQKERNGPRGGWATPDSVPGILIGVVARSSLEIVSIYTINLLSCNKGIFNSKEWIGFSGLLFIGLFSCFVRRGQKTQSGNTSTCSFR